MGVQIPHGNLPQYCLLSRIKLRVASYHTTKVIAHQTQQPVIANCVPKLVAMATSLSTYRPIQHMIPTAHPSPQPKRHPYRFSHLCTDDRRVSLYFTMGRPFSPKNLPLPMGGSGPPSNTWFPGATQVLNPNGSSIGAAVFAGLTSVTDRPTDDTTRSIRIGRIYVRSTAMRPNNIKFVTQHTESLTLINYCFRFPHH